MNIRYVVVFISNVRKKLAVPRCEYVLAYIRNFAPTQTKWIFLWSAIRKYTSIG